MIIFPPESLIQIFWAETLYYSRLGQYNHVQGTRSKIRRGTQSQEYRQSRALRTMTVGAFNFKLVPHAFGYVFTSHLFLEFTSYLVASLLPEAYLILWEVLQKSDLYRARKSVVLKLGCVGRLRRSSLGVLVLFYGVSLCCQQLVCGQ